METTNAQTDLYGFTGTLFRLWTKAEALYGTGNRSPDDYFDKDESAELAALGLRVMDVYDYVEDFVNAGDPDFGTFILVSAERIFHFLEEDGGRFAETRIREEDLPPKTDAVDGVEWLPRILVKAKAKLRGELPPELMYGCGGDRRFLRNRGIHPVEFLRKVRAASDDREVIDWVVSRSGGA